MSEQHGSVGDLFLASYRPTAAFNWLWRIIFHDAYIKVYAHLAYASVSELVSLSILYIVCDLLTTSLLDNMYISSANSPRTLSAPLSQCTNDPCQLLRNAISDVLPIKCAQRNEWDRNVQLDRTWLPAYDCYVVRFFAHHVSGMRSGLCALRSRAPALDCSACDRTRNYNCKHMIANICYSAYVSQAEAYLEEVFGVRPHPRVLQSYINMQYNTNPKS